MYAKALYLKHLIAYYGKFNETFPQKSMTTTGHCSVFMHTIVKDFRQFVIMNKNW